MGSLVRTASAFLLSAAVIASPAITADGGGQHSRAMESRSNGLRPEGSAKQGTMHEYEPHAGSVEKGGMAKDRMKK
ncbi:hypothetical protein J2X36_004837 [Methylobacterium sp. BE186]|uniref:hypothetical protein n=1 Tax=Methylobacterium sp. BE186 TaxID=2817715 RepID=UPI00285A3006|nr:hypothetical protein [Methylobacterium sp. BE186]MDR7040057.1 hypothetical protein [Methylobacterium sp. BE186]